MPRYEIVLQQDGVDQARYEVDEQGLVIGRASECDIVIPDSLVSRRHVRIWHTGDALRVQDLGSRNGVMVNGRPVVDAVLSIEDVLNVGGRQLVVHEARPSDVLGATTTMIPFEEAQELYSEIMREEGGGRLGTLYRAAELMGTVFDLDGLLGQALELIFDALPIERGYVVTIESDSLHPVLRASRHRDGDAAKGPPMSRTLLNHVLTERTSILTRNAQQDERFEPSASIMSHEIRAAMCAPLYARSEVIGALYVDCGAHENPFGPEDLQLLTAMGRVMGVAIDNAQLHRERLHRERLEAIGEAAAGIGHCVKNVLVGVKGGGEFIDMGIEKEDWQWIHKGWPLVRRSLMRIEDIVLNLMSYSRDSEPQYEPHLLRELAQEAVNLSKPRAETHGVRLLLKTEDQMHVEVDGREIFRVILNLVTNGIEACDAGGGEVHVLTRVEHERAIIEVADTGPGIPDSVRGRLFQAFVTTKGSKGTGLGLATCDRIVRAHRGNIEVHTAPGEGTQIRIELPANPSTRPAGGGAMPSSLPPQDPQDTQ